MTAEQIKEIVRLTLIELTTQGKMKEPKYDDTVIYEFFDGKKNDNGVCKALQQLSDDQYIDIIYLYYRDKKTLEWIAEYFNRDVSTIKRNKQRLIKKILGGIYG